MKNLLPAMNENLLKNCIKRQFIKNQTMNEKRKNMIVY